MANRNVLGRAIERGEKFEKSKKKLLGRISPSPGGESEYLTGSRFGHYWSALCNSSTLNKRLFRLSFMPVVALKVSPGYTYNWTWCMVLVLLYLAFVWAKKAKSAKPPAVDLIGFLDFTRERRGGRERKSSFPSRSLSRLPRCGSKVLEILGGAPFSRQMLNISSISDGETRRYLDVRTISHFGEPGEAHTELSGETRENAPRMPKIDFAKNT